MFMCFFQIWSQLESFEQYAGNEDVPEENSIHIPLARQPRRSSMAGRVSHKGAALSCLTCIMQAACLFQGA